MAKRTKAPSAQKHRNWCVVEVTRHALGEYREIHGPYPSREKALVEAEYLRCGNGSECGVCMMIPPDR